MEKFDKAHNSFSKCNSTPNLNVCFALNQSYCSEETKFSACFFVAVFLFFDNAEISLDYDNTAVYYLDGGIICQICRRIKLKLGFGFCSPKHGLTNV